MASAVHHLRLRLDGEYLAFVIMKQTLAEISLRGGQGYLGVGEAAEMAEMAMEAVRQLTGEDREKEEGNGT